MIQKLGKDESLGSQEEKGSLLDVMKDLNLARISVIIWFGW